MSRSRALRSYKNRVQPAFKDFTQYSWNQDSYLDVLLKKYNIPVEDAVFGLSSKVKSKLIHQLKNKRHTETRELLKELKLLKVAGEGEWVHIPQKKKVPGIRWGIARPNRKASTGKRQVKNIQKKRD